MSVVGQAAGDAGVEIVDTRTARTPWYAPLVVPVLNDPRDAQFVGLMLQCAAFAGCGVALYFSGKWLWYLAPLYWLTLLVAFVGRFTLMLHCTSHRPLFKPRARALGMDHVIPWLLGPFFGQTPNTYFAHHMGMHHVEENLADDLSSTLPYQRDNFFHWLHYWGMFLIGGLPNLARYLKRKQRNRLRRKVFIGEGAYWSAIALLAWLAPKPTLVVFVLPLLMIRTLMMMGNWSQHAFIAQGAPNNPYLASITCINSRYNRQCFNDGYHIGHHLHAKAHWTEYPSEFEANLAEYGRQDAIVFAGLDFFMIWLLLMTHRFSVLARAFVQLPGAPQRTRAEIERLLRERVRPVPLA